MGKSNECGAVGAKVKGVRGRAPRAIGSLARAKGCYDFAAYAPHRLTNVAKFIAAVEEHSEQLADPGVIGWMKHAARKSRIVSYGHLLKLSAFCGHARDLVVDPCPQLLWSGLAHNIIVNVGLDDILDKYFLGSSYTAAHYLGLIDGTPSPVAGDTMSSHGSWNEVTGYSESNRQTISFDAVDTQSIDNDGSKAVITASGSITVGGGFCTTDNTKGGTSGTLVSAAALDGGDESLTSSETLTLTYTCGMADDGA